MSNYSKDNLKRLGLYSQIVRAEKIDNIISNSIEFSEEEKNTYLKKWCDFNNLSSDEEMPD